MNTKNTNLGKVEPINWRQIVESKGHGAEARAILSKALTGDESVLDNADLEYINKQDFITAVPIEIALSTTERNIIKKESPECQWIVTGIPANAVKHMQDDYGYTITMLPKIEKKAVKKEEKVESSESYEFTYSINGKEFKAKGNNLNELDAIVNAFFKELND